jgi:hypothetical protein
VFYALFILYTLFAFHESPDSCLGYVPRIIFYA